jgi:anaerobic selenocysteine-containing dehydrogenase
MKFSRRDLFIGGAGIAAGMVFTPVPWKLLGDSSIWTQNWPWIPQAAHGPVETKQSVCTLCASGCGIRVRMAAGWPVGISGVATNPMTKGALCPLAFAAQQLNWHPQRLREVRHGGRTASWQDAQAAFDKACSEGALAIVDGRPGRAASSVLETFAKKRNGSYRVVLDEESQALAPYANWSGTSVTALGYDVRNARTIVSFGAPLLDGWGTPGQFTRLWSEKAAGAADPQLRLIQIEPKLSRTGARAWSWTAIHVGSEEALAAGLAQVLIQEHLVSGQAPEPPQMSLVDAAAQTGLSSDAIRELAHTLVERRPVVAIAPDDNPAIGALNVVLGAVGTPGGIVAKSKMQSACVPLETGASYRAMLFDASVPWDFVPQTNAEVFRFAAWDGGGNKADWLLPSPGFAEELTDVPSAPTSAVETYAIAVNLVPQPGETKTAAQFLAKVDSTLPEVDKAIHARCEQLFQGKAGIVYGEKTIAVTKFESAAKLEEQLRQGAIWVGDPPRTGGLKCALKEWPPAATNPSQAMDWASTWQPPVFPPLAAKLYQESDLREAPGRGQA